MDHDHPFEGQGDLLKQWHEQEEQVGIVHNDFPITPAFVTAGKAIFTVHNDKGDHYTFKVNRHKKNQIWFVSLLTGSDNDNDYTYMGVLNKGTGNVVLTYASKFKDDSKPVQVIRWALKLLWANKPLPTGYGIHGEGRCGRCGRTLTHPDGISPEGHRFGFGPHCWLAMQAA